MSNPYLSTVQSWLDNIDSENFLLGKTSKADYYDYETYEVFLQEGDEITYDAIERLRYNGLLETEAVLQLKPYADIGFYGIPT